MRATCSVHAQWDPEASVWVATSDDVPGLCVEAPTVEELTVVVLELVPELLVLNGVLAEGEAGETPVRITAEREAVARRAA
jgi:hypothetical protein